MAQVPTILIGLGGLGSSIVDTIYSWIPPDKREFVAIHAFDTNVNDISKLKNLKRENLTQTSTNWTVGEYLRMADDSVKDWFPYEQTEIQRKSLTDGAGQIRAVSRLAYRASMESGKLSNLHNSINHIFRETGDAMTSSARVMIICSIVGGTGAGIFLQTAMYMRDLLELDFHRKNVLIRGAFILPDCLVLSNIIHGDEIENIRANAYASIKELNAITRNAAMNNGGKEGVNIELEYKPNQVDAQGRLAHVISQRNLPYNFAFLFDFENTEKNNIKYFSNYIMQVARASYLDLFSPMANDRFSKQDNQILSMIENNGLSRYCGAGVSSLVYPYNDMVYYYGLKWSAEGLSNEWLKIDEQYESDFRQYERDLKSGIPREKPLLADRYREILFQLANQQTPMPFFKQAYAAAHILDKRGEIGRPKAELFLDALGRRVDSIINTDEKLRGLQAQCGLDENRLKDTAPAKDEITNREEGLYYYEQGVRTFIQNTKNYLLNEVTLQDADLPEAVSGDDYKLNTWILKQPEAMHPVTVRFFLYQVERLLEAKIKELTPTNDLLERAIDNYKKAYNLDDTEDIIETAVDRIEAASRQGPLSRLMNNKFKDFVNEYIDKSGKQLNSLNRYRKDRLTEYLYRDLQKAVQDMSAEWENYFKNLRDVRNSLNNELSINATKHDNASDPTIVYVLSSADNKAKVWESIRLDLGTDQLPAAIAAQMYIGQYQRFVKKRKGDYLTEQAANRVEEMFRKDVLNWCIEKIQKVDALNLNIVRALRREAQLKALPDDQINRYIKDKIAMLNNLARPFVPAANNVTEINSWGVNPQSTAEMAGTDKKDLFGDSDLIEDGAFSTYEIIRSRTIFGLTIDHFTKFYCGDNMGAESGEYYKAYNNRIRKLTQQGNTVTPHLDKRWHLQAYLPEISQLRIDEDRTNINRSLIWGILYGYLQNINEYGRLTWLFNDDAGSRLIQAGSQPADQYMHSLYQALYHNPIIVDKVLKRSDEQSARDMSDYRDDISKHAFYNRAQALTYFPAGASRTINMVDAILRFPDGNPSDQSLITDGNALLKMLLDEIMAYYIKVMGSYRATLAKQQAIAFIDDLLAKSEYYQQADRAGIQYRTWQNIVDEVKRS